MAELETLPLGRALLLVKDTGMKGHEVTALAGATIGLSALAETDAPVPLAILDEWQGYLNRIRTSRRNPLPPRNMGVRIWEDGAPG